MLKIFRLMIGLVLLFSTMCIQAFVIRNDTSCAGCNFYKITVADPTNPHDVGSLPQNSTKTIHLNETSQFVIKLWANVDSLSIIKPPNGVIRCYGSLYFTCVDLSINGVTIK